MLDQNDTVTYGHFATLTAGVRNAVDTIDKKVISLAETVEKRTRTYGKEAGAANQGSVCEKAKRYSDFEPVNRSVNDVKMAVRLFFGSYNYSRGI